MGSRRRSTPDDIERRRHILTKKTPAVGRGVATACVIKDRGVFLTTDRGGQIPMEGPHGFGLYYHDCRYLDGYLLRMNGRAPITLVSTTASGFRAIFELANPELPAAGGGVVGQHEVAIRWDRVVEGDRRALHEVLRVKNFAAEAVEITLGLTFRAEFEDVYAVRNLCARAPGKASAARWDGARLRFRYEGTDDLVRTTDVRCWRRPDDVDGREARFVLRLAAEAEEEIALSITLGEIRRGEPEPEAASEAPDIEAIDRRQRAHEARHARGLARPSTGHVPLQQVLQRSLDDLAMLRSELSDQAFYSAGIPWFVALFGRDSLLVAMQTLAYDPDVAAQTLRLLALHQGTADDASRDEEPGKILHEYRVGELAHTGVIPHTPYYGTVDATPLFLITLARHAAWTGQLDLFRELRANVDAALEWMARYGQSKTTGYLQYQSRATGGLGNQGWKDSGDAIVMADGTLARQPIALVEVQGYVYLAKTEVAALFDRAGEPATAARLRKEAAELKARFTRDYWLPNEGFFALALTPDGPAAVLSSNAGQALWSGIVEPEEARRTSESLLHERMFSGWGIRTLAEDDRRYNPVAYHRGTVWPHDNALIVAGFRRYGFDDAACRVFEGMVDAAGHFSMRRLPELFAGFRRCDYGVPVRYPVACHPQAWAAASVPFMLERLLGLTPEAFDDRLRIVRPVLPASVRDVAIRGLRVGGAVVSLAFERQGDGRVEVRVLESEGTLDVKVEPAGMDPG